MIPSWENHLGKITVWSLIYFLNYSLLPYLEQSQILVISLYVLWPLDKMVQNWIANRSIACNFRVYIFLKSTYLNWVYLDGREYLFLDDDFHLRWDWKLMTKNQAGSNSTSQGFDAKKVEFFFANLDFGDNAIYPMVGFIYTFCLPVQF